MGGIDPQRAFFVDVGVAHGDGDRVDRYVHHDYVEDLYADAEGGDEYDVEATQVHGQGLEEPVEDAVVGGDGFDGGVADVDEFEGDPVGDVEGDNSEEEPPGGATGEEIGVDAAGVFENEADCCFVVAEFFIG